MKMKLLALSVVAVAVLAGCGKKEETAAPAAAPVAAPSVINIGHVGPTSGGIAHLGKDNENGARMAIDELNARGADHRWHQGHLRTAG